MAHLRSRQIVMGLPLRQLSGRVRDTAPIAGSQKRIYHSLMPGPSRVLTEVGTMLGPKPQGAAMKRRDFISLLGGAAAWPLAARAQQSERVRRVAVLMAHKEGDPGFQDYLGAFRQGLLKLGWIGTSVSTLAGEHSTTWTKGNSPLKNFWSSSPISFLRRTRRQLSRCCTKRVPSQLFLWLLP